MFRRLRQGQSNTPGVAHAGAGSHREHGIAPDHRHWWQPLAPAREAESGGPARCQAGSAPAARPGGEVDSSSFTGYSGAAAAGHADSSVESGSRTTNLYWSGSPGPAADARSGWTGWTRGSRRTCRPARARPTAAPDFAFTFRAGSASHRSGTPARYQAGFPRPPPGGRSGRGSSTAGDAARRASL